MTSGRLLPTVSEPMRPQACPEPACSATLELPYLCGSCGTLLREPPGMSHFARFGLEPTMDLDEDRLEELYMALTRKMHPDRMMAKKASVQTRALILTSALNDSYRVLKDERQRAEHMLELAGGPSSDAHKSAPPAFLMEMMDLHEQVEEARDAADAARLDALDKAAAERASACLAQVRAQFAQPSPDLVALREQLNVAKYWHTLRGEIATARKAS